MRLSFEKPLVIALALVFIAGTVGCQSGFKFHNPFTKTPKAENAKAPSELDELDGIDGLTPPPENYTKGESDSKKSSKDSESFAQKGRYEAGESAQTETKVAISDSSAPKEDAAPVTAAAQPAPAASSVATYAQSEPAPAVNSAFPTAQTAPAANDFPVAAAPAASSAFPTANDFPVAAAPAASNAFPTANDFPVAAAPTANNAFPTANDFPVAAAPTANNAPFPTVAPDPAPGVASVALNYDPAAQQAASSAQQPAAPSVVYEPQTISTGKFAPGSTSNIY